MIFSDYHIIILVLLYPCIGFIAIGLFFIALKAFSNLDDIFVSTGILIILVSLFSFFDIAVIPFTEKKALATSIQHAVFCFVPIVMIKNIYDICGIKRFFFMLINFSLAGGLAAGFSMGLFIKGGKDIIVMNQYYFIFIPFFLTLSVYIFYLLIKNYLSQSDIVLKKVFLYNLIGVSLLFLFGLFDLFRLIANGGLGLEGISFTIFAIFFYIIITILLFTKYLGIVLYRERGINKRLSSVTSEHHNLSTSFKSFMRVSGSISRIQNGLLSIKSDLNEFVKKSNPSRRSEMKSIIDKLTDLIPEFKPIEEEYRDEDTDVRKELVDIYETLSSKVETILKKPGGSEVRFNFSSKGIKTLIYKSYFNKGVDTLLNMLDRDRSKRLVITLDKEEALNQIRLVVYEECASPGTDTAALRNSSIKLAKSCFLACNVDFCAAPTKSVLGLEGFIYTINIPLVSEQGYQESLEKVMASFTSKSQEVKPGVVLLTRGIYDTEEIIDRLESAGVVADAVYSAEEFEERYEDAEFCSVIGGEQAISGIKNPNSTHSYYVLKKDKQGRYVVIIEGNRRVLFNDKFISEFLAEGNHI